MIVDQVYESDSKRAVLGSGMPSIRQESNSQVRVDGGALIQVNGIDTEAGIWGRFRRRQVRGDDVSASQTHASSKFRVKTSRR